MFGQIQKYSVYWYKEKLPSLLLCNDFVTFGRYETGYLFCTGPTGNNAKLQIVPSWVLSLLLMFVYVKSNSEIFNLLVRRKTR
jgi:hypothetical protein